MSDERHMHNAPDVRHPPRGEGVNPDQYCFGCARWKPTLGFRGAGSVKRRCAGCVQAKAQREVTA